MRRVYFCALCACLAVGIFAASPGDARAAEPAPTFTFRTIDGKTVRLVELKGHPVVIDFWATWCVPCRASMPHLNRLQIRYRDRGLVVMGLSVDDEEPRAVRRYADSLGLTFRIGLADERVLDLYGPLRAIPTTVFINRRGEIVRRVVGYIDGETMESFVVQLF